MNLTAGCGLAGLRSLPAASVDLLFSDLPSGATRADFDRPVDLADLWAASWPCMKPRGVVVLMASNMRYAAELVNSEHRRFRYDLVWEKTRATGFLNSKRQPLRAHEFLLVFYQRQPDYHPQKTTGHDPVHFASGPHGGVNYGDSGACKDRGGSTERYPRSVLEFAPVPNVGSARRHAQQKPVDLLRWVVRSFTNPGDLIVDPCAGSGSMGVAATEEARSFIGWDLEPKPPIEQTLDPQLPLLG